MNYPIKASLFPAVCFAVAGVILLYVAQLLVVPEGGAVMFTRIVWGNYISPVIVGIFLIAIFLLLDKRRKLNKSKLNEVSANPKFNRNLLAHRWQQSLYPETENARTFGENELEHLENSYSVPRFFVWALPIIGFVGTVWGIGLSISFFSDTMSAGQSGTSVSTLLQQNIPLVTKGLSTAFDTTDERDHLLKLDEHWRRFSSTRYDPANELSQLDDDEYAHAQAVGESLRDQREDAFERQEQRLQYRD